MDWFEIGLKKILQFLIKVWYKMIKSLLNLFSNENEVFFKESCSSRLFIDQSRF